MTVNELYARLLQLMLERKGDWIVKVYNGYADQSFHDSISSLEELEGSKEVWLDS